MQVIKFDESKAKNADGSNFITQSGKYIVAIVQARMWESRNGATMLELLLKELTGGAFCWLPVCLLSRDGQPTIDYNKIQSLMGLLGVAELAPVASQVVTRNNERVDGFRCMAIEKKAIGIVLQRLNDVYKDSNTGEMRERHPMRLVSFFDAQTEKTFSETKTGKEAKRIAERVGNLSEASNTKAYDEWLAAGKPSSASISNNGGAPAPVTADDLGEDIPF